MTSLCISPEARSAAHRCLPAYQIAVGQDLFGAWLVEMSYGRIGNNGTRQGPFVCDNRGSSGAGGCMLAEARDRHTGSACHTRCGWRQSVHDEAPNEATHHNAGPWDEKSAVLR